MHGARPLLVAATLLACLHGVAALIEMVNETGRQDSEFRLTCRQLSSRIAVMEARFTSDDAAPVFPNASSFFTALYDAVNVRLALNHRCSGRNHCSFILHADCPGSKFWGPGELFIKYACMPESRLTRFCNLAIPIPVGGGPAAQGFIASPGYPHFYVGQSACRWRLEAAAPQRVELTLLDVSLGGATAGSSRCEDTLELRDNQELLASTCAEQDPPLVLVSRASVLEVTLLGREGSLVPKRGVLLYYRAVECPTLPAPLDGYLVYRNATAAEYRCCVGFAFPDTGARARLLHCLHNRWDLDLPKRCVNLQNLTQIEEVTDEQKIMTENSHLIDVVIPSMLIAGLLVGNAIIVFFIYQYRKRKNVEIQEEELNTMVGETSNNVP